MFTLAKLLLPIDFSARSADAAHFAKAIAQHFGSQVTLLHVLAPHLANVRADAERKLGDFLAVEWHHFPANHVLLEGDIAETIVQYARSEHIDLIMMPTHGYGPFRRLLLGSITAKVLHDADCLVWTAVHIPETPPEPEAAKPRRIGCAVDLGPQSNVVVKWANRLAWEFGASLTFIHVVASIDPRQQSYYLSPEWRGHLIKTAEAEVASLRDLAGVHGDIRIEIGPIASAVSASAKDAGADLLVIGRGSRDRLYGRLPTYSYSIIRESPCPVLSV